MVRLVALLCAVILLLALPAGVLAKKPLAGCPASASGFVHVDRDGWWDRTVEGFVTEGIPVYAEGGGYTAAFEQFARDFGFDSAAELKAWVLGEQWDGFDLNRNGWVCMKTLPSTPGIPAYVFQPADDVSSAWR
jgi:hypothetical protein